MKAEIDQLLEADIIFEVKYPTWLAKLVMVKKSGGRWRMWIDFTDLNKHCLKDCCPLPLIEQKASTAAGYEVLFLLDLYKAYHQVLMDLIDADKSTFVTDWGVFANKKMPFGLKNTGATKQ